EIGTGARNVVIDNFNVHGSSSSGMYLSNLEQITVTNSTLESNQEGIYLERTTNSQFTNNKILNNTDQGIFDDANSTTRSVIISHNVISGNGMQGIYSQEGTFFDISNNFLHDNGGSGSF